MKSLLPWILALFALFVSAFPFSLASSSLARDSSSISQAPVGDARPPSSEIAQKEKTQPPSDDDAQEEETTVPFTISSSSFQDSGEIARKFTCDGDDVSPQLSWANPPKGTKSFVLIADDPDAPAGTWTHWVIFDLPPQTASLPEGVPKTEDVLGGGRQARNDFRKVGYGGPCPPPGKPHRYFFRLYALDRMLNLKGSASKQDVEQAMRTHIVDEAEMMGTYHR